MHHRSPPHLQPQTLLEGRPPRDCSRSIPISQIPWSIMHPSAWKRNSRKFTVASDSSTRFQHLDNRRWCSPPAPKRSDLVAVVAPFCIKGLRLVTMQLPEKFSPIGLGTNRRFANRVSRKLGNTVLGRRGVSPKLTAQEETL